MWLPSNPAKTANAAYHSSFIEHEVNKISHGWQLSDDEEVLKDEDTYQVFSIF